MNKQINKPSVDSNLLSLQKAISNLGKGLNKDKNTRIVNDIVTVLNSELSTLNKNLLSTNKVLIGEMKHLTKTITNNQNKDEIFKRKDPNAQILNELEQGNLYAKRNNELMKERNKIIKKSDGGLLGMIGAILGGSLMIGGLTGFLLTGKKELLNDMWKGLLKYSPVKFIVRMFDGALNSAKKPIAKMVGKAFTGIFKSGIFGKGLQSVTKHGMEGFGSRLLAKIGGKGLAKLGGKVGKSILGKTTKSFLKKVPVIGGLLGLIFGIQRFKKGDWLGGTLEVASGISSVVPGVGTALSIAIDSFLLFRDIKNLNKTEEEKKDIFKSDKSTLRKLPVIGSIIDITDGIKVWKSDKSKGIQLVMKGLIGLNPISSTLKTVSSLVDIFGDGINGNKKQNKSSPLKSFFGIGKGEGDPTASMQPKRYSSSIYSKSNELFEKMKDTGYGTIAEKSMIRNSVKDIPSVYKYKDSVNLAGLHPDVWHNFVGMANEYYALTGEPIQVNSAYRDTETQRKLYQQAVRTGRTNYVAKPGRSLHEYGFAIDINSNVSNKLDRMGLMSKWKFNRPLKNHPRNPEPWHIEPVGLDRSNKVLRSDTTNEKNSIGDRILESNVDANLPSIKINNSRRKEQEPMVLSEASLDKLAEKIGYQFRKSLPETGSGVSGSPIVARR